MLVLDEDEFAEHQVKYSYPADVIAASLDTTRQLKIALADSTEPFASVYLTYLAMVKNSEPA